MALGNFFGRHFVSGKGVRRRDARQSNSFGTRLARFEPLEQRALLSVSPTDIWDDPAPDWGVPVDVPQNPDVDISDKLRALYAEYATEGDDFQADIPGVHVEDNRVAIGLFLCGREEGAVDELRALGLEDYYFDLFGGEEGHGAYLYGYLSVERLVDLSTVDSVWMVFPTTNLPENIDRLRPRDFNSPEHILSEWFTDDLIQVYIDYLASPDIVPSEHPGIELDSGRVGVCVDTLAVDTEARVEQLKSLGMEVVDVSGSKISGWLPVELFLDVTEIGGPFLVRPTGRWGVPLLNPPADDGGLDVDDPWEHYFGNLEAVYAEYASAPDDFHSDARGIRGDRVAIEVHTNGTAETADALRSLGLEEDKEYIRQPATMTYGFLPIERLPDVIDVDGVGFVWATTPPWIVPPSKPCTRILRAS